ncbi:hypothetical protein A5713_25905 [Mycobacterium sp. E2497]|nr:hypothetical protein A5713_25905 [Mycobacterium sp. E2497]
MVFLFVGVQWDVSRETSGVPAGLVAPMYRTLAVASGVVAQMTFGYLAQLRVRLMLCWKDFGALSAHLPA